MIKIALFFSENLSLIWVRFYFDERRRKNDRGFNPGDELHLKETRWSATDMSNGANLEYTGRIIAVRVKYIFHGPAYGLAGNYCVMASERA